MQIYTGNIQNTRRWQPGPAPRRPGRPGARDSGPGRAAAAWYFVYFLYIFVYILIYSSLYFCYIRRAERFGLRPRLDTAICTNDSSLLCDAFLGIGGHFGCPHLQLVHV